MQRDILTQGLLAVWGWITLGIGAKIANPESHVFVLTGDGSFGFTAIELDTLVRHKVPI